MTRITKAGDQTTLRTFSTQDGLFGYGPPAVGGDGAFYGVATSGGANGLGTIWRFAGFNFSGTFTVLRSFSAGELPVGPLVKGREGAFYGLIFNNGVATRYRITSTGQYSTQGSTLSTDGEPAQVALVERNLGKFYAPLFGPSASDTPRNLFEFGATASSFMALAPSPAVSFPISGAPAIGGLSRGTDRNLYGVLPDGAGNSGSLYRVVMSASGDPLPGATTLAATNVQSLSATLNGEVTPNGTPVVVFFEYGATTAYGKRTPGVLVQPGASATIAVSATATGLTRNAEFQFRLVAENDGGTATGADQSATTTSNSVPLAITDEVPIRAKEVLTISVLANDSDPDGDAFTLDSFTQGTAGVVTRVGDNLIYTPGKAFAGTDTFTYTISDSLGATSVGQVVVKNPFLVLGGSYSALVGNDDGLLTVKVSTGGALTGKIKLGARTYTLKGTVGLDGAFTQTISRKGMANLIVTLSFTATGGLARVSGGVNGGGLEIFAIAPDAKLAKTLPAPAVAGKYTILLTPDNVTMPAAMHAPGWAIANLLRSGNVTLSGVTPDGKSLSLSGAIRVDGSVSIFKIAPAPGSSFIGSFTFASAPDGDLAGSLRWTRGAVTKGIFLGAFDTAFTLKGSKFTPPAKGIHTLAYSSPLAAKGSLELKDGGISGMLSRIFDIDLKDKATLALGESIASSVKITLISRTDGRFEGTFKHPSLPITPTIKFRGVQLQTPAGGTGPNHAKGFFTTPTAAGTFIFTPQ